MIINNYTDYKYIDFLRILNLSLKLESELNRIDQIEIAFEALMLKICAMDSTVQITDLIIQNNSSSSKPMVVKEKNNNHIEKKEIEKQTNKHIEEPIKEQQNNIENQNQIDSIDLIYFIDNWENIKIDIGKADSKLSIFLENSKPDKFLDNELKVNLPDGNVFQANNLQKNKEIFEKVILRRINKKVKISFYSKELEKKTTKENPLTKDHPLMNDAIEMFNGEIIK